VSDREIRRLARSGACSLRKIAESCGAGTACGGCRPSVRAILEDVDAASERRAFPVAPASSPSPEAA